MEEELENIKKLEEALSRTKYVEVKQLLKSEAVSSFHLIYIYKLFKIYFNFTFRK